LGALLNQRQHFIRGGIWVLFLLGFVTLWLWSGHVPGPGPSPSGHDLVHDLEQAGVIDTPIPAMLRRLRSADPVWQDHDFSDLAAGASGNALALAAQDPFLTVTRDATLVSEGSRSLKIHRPGRHAGDVVLAVDVPVPGPGLYRLSAQAAYRASARELAATLTENRKVPSFRFVLRPRTSVALAHWTQLDPHLEPPVERGREGAPVTADLFQKLLVRAARQQLGEQTWWPLESTVLVNPGHHAVRLQIDGRRFAGAIHVDSVKLRRTLPEEELLEAGTYRYAGGAPTLHYHRKMVQRDREDRLSLFVPAPSRIDYRLTPRDRTTLEVGMAVLDPPQGMQPEGPSRLTVEVEDQAGAVTVLASHEAVPGTPVANQWVDHRIDLSRWAGRTIQLRLRSDGAMPGEGPTGFRGAGAFSPVRILGAENHSPRRSVLLITADELHAGHVGFLGYDRPTTPTLDRLAASGAAFSSTIVQAPLTFFSMPSMHTSSYLRAGTREDFGYHLRPDAVTLADVLRSQGYATAAFMSEYYYNNFFKGFDRRICLPTSLSTEAIDREHLARAVRFLETRRDEPFFLWIHLLSSHTPWRPQGEPAAFLKAVHADLQEVDACQHAVDAGLDPDSAAARRARTVLTAAYDGSIRSMDDCVKTLLDTVDRLGLTDRTLVVFTSDHGVDLAPRTFLERTFTEDTLRVPMAMRLPGVIPAGSRHDGPVEMVDVAPTILDLLGLAPPSSFEGKSLAPVLDGAIHHKDAAFTRIFDRVGILTRRWALHRRESRNHAAHEITLLDRLHALPGEPSNVAARHPDVAADLDQRLQQWLDHDRRNLDRDEIGNEVRRFLEDSGYLKPGVVRAEEKP
jgi:arylsulfatase A-like enzyme